MVVGSGCANWIAGAPRSVEEFQILSYNDEYLYISGKNNQKKLPSPLLECGHSQNMILSEM